MALKDGDADQAVRDRKAGVIAVRVECHCDVGAAELVKAEPKRHDGR
jgi:hypothetical protein